MANLECYFPCESLIAEEQVLVRGTLVDFCLHKSGKQRFKSFVRKSITNGVSQLPAPPTCNFFEKS